MTTKIKRKKEILLTRVEILDSILRWIRAILVWIQAVPGKVGVGAGSVVGQGGEQDQEHDLESEQDDSEFLFLESHVFFGDFLCWLVLGPGNFRPFKIVLLLVP